jgi:hypothetical protein
MCEFEYFVSYGWFSDNTNGFGSIKIILKKPIVDINQIREIEGYITDKFSCGRVNFKAMVLYWCRFEDRLLHGKEYDHEEGGA